MKIKIDHQAGQYRAELFELLTLHLLRAMFQGAIVLRGLVIPRTPEEGGPASLSLDFAVIEGRHMKAIAETKAPYTDSASFGINKTIRRLKDAFERLPTELKPKEVMVIIASELPAASVRDTELAAEFFSRFGSELRVLDAKSLVPLLSKHLKITMHSFSIENLEKAVREVDPKAVRGEQRPAGVEHEEGRGPLGPALPFPLSGGEHDNVVVLCADFCSYTKFVQASGADRDLITSVMGRFYRETRRIIEDCGAVVDKYMGDGILAFWMPSSCSRAELGKKVEACSERLVTCALGIAKEWQDQIDHSVEVIGMRVGAAIGKVLFISEGPEGEGPLHAISDYINLAARLQSAAKENSFVISNRLKKLCFEGDDAFQEREPLELKNFGKVVAWSKDYEKG